MTYTLSADTIRNPLYAYLPKLIALLSLQARTGTIAPPPPPPPPNPPPARATPPPPPLHQTDTALVLALQIHV